MIFEKGKRYLVEIRGIQKFFTRPFEVRCLDVCGDKVALEHEVFPLETMKRPIFTRAANYDIIMEVTE